MAHSINLCENARLLGCKGVITSRGNLLCDDCIQKKKMLMKEQRDSDLFEMSQQIKDLQMQLSNQRLEYTNHLNEIKASHHQELASLKNDDDLNKLQSQLANFEQEINELKQAHQQELENLAKSHQQELEEMTKAHQQELEDQKLIHDSIHSYQTMQQLELEYNQQLATIQAGHRQQIVEMTREFDQQITDLQNTITQLIKEKDQLFKTAQEMEKTFNETLVSLKDENNGLKQGLQSCEYTIQDLKQEHRQQIISLQNEYQEQLKYLNECVNIKSNEKLALQDKIDALEAQLAEQQSSDNNDNHSHIEQLEKENQLLFEANKKLRIENQDLFDSLATYEMTFEQMKLDNLKLSTQ